MPKIINNSENIILSNSQTLLQKVFSSQTQNTFTITDPLEFNYLLLSQSSESKITFDVQSENVKGNIFAVYFADGSQKSDIYVNITNSNSNINVYMLSFLTTDRSYELNGHINLGKNILNSQGHLLEKNIILSDKIKIKSIPRLDVYSNDIQATHGLSIDRLDLEKMFYLQSKGLSDNESPKLIISGYLKEIFSHFPDISETLTQELEQTVLSTISFLS